MPLFIALFCLLKCFFPEGEKSNEPLHFEMWEAYQAVNSRQFAFTIQGKDTSLVHEVYLLQDSVGFPLFYYSDILTPVCIDNICKPMAIEIYWNLAGHYVGYGVHQDELLTKYDHDLFETEDYQKLHDLLLDRHSILEQKTLDDLFDHHVDNLEKVTFNGKEVDAISGATKKEISASVVEGALYSCYTIWHLVHGPVVREIKEHLAALQIKGLKRCLLFSPYEDYQIMAIQRFEGEMLGTYLDRILEIFKTGNPLLRSVILKKLPKSYWSDERFDKMVYGIFAQLDLNSKTLLMNNLAYLSPAFISSLMFELKHFSKNQLRTYLAFLEKHPSQFTPKMLVELKRVGLDPNYAYGYLVEIFLEKSNK